MKSLQISKTGHFIDETGDLDEVVVIEDRTAKIKFKYLMEYISVRKVYFALCFDFMRFIEADFKSLGIKAIDKNYKSSTYFYNHYVRSVSDIKSGQLQSWIHGKCVIAFDKNKSNKYYFDSDKNYESFITGYDNNGEEVLTSCERKEENYFTLTYFKKEVLNKYYNDPDKYTVTNFNVQCSFFSIKIDNNIQEYIPIFLPELGMLPYKEQLHWKHYNISPKSGISRTYYRTMIEGRWSEHPETPDAYFKYKYKWLNNEWEKKYGWKFYKPLAKESEHYLNSLHIPTTNSIKSFCEQILALVILTIDSLNENKIGEGLTLEPNIKGIAKLDLFLKSKDTEMPGMIEFLKHLQNLRSGLIAHRFSTSNKSVQKSISYFGLTENNRVEVANEIFIKSVYTLNSIEKHFL